MAEREKITEEISEADVGPAKEILSGKTPEKIPAEKTKPEFTLTPVKRKPQRKYRKGSKYDPILDGFLKASDPIVSVEVPGKDGNYLRTQLNKRLEAKKLTGKIRTSVINNVCYLEKVK